MSTLDPPVFVNVTVSDCWDPSVTLGKASLVGLSANCPGEDEPPLLQLPVSVIDVTLLDALLATLSVALKVPAALGVNTTLMVVLCPEETVAGRVGAVNEKY
jgi:hypothetical protein